MQNTGNWLTPSTKCPDSCCQSTDSECQNLMDNTGNVIIPGEEIMLIFGGLTYRQQTFNKN